LHTIRTQLEYFRYLAPLRADNFTVYAVDLPGHGRSPIDKAAPYDEPYLRQGIIQFIERLDLRERWSVSRSGRF
jgi:pimeloyl-ACP methyl ester carboxylesterase